MIEFVSKMDDASREKFGQDLGCSMLLAARNVADLHLQQYTTPENSIDYLRVIMARQLVGVEVANFSLYEGEDIALPTITPVLQALESGEYKPFSDSIADRGLLLTSSVDLSVEAIDDCVYWFSAIDARTDVKNGSSDDVTYTASPTIASAMSLTHEVNSTVRVYLEIAEKHGDLVDLPKTRKEFIELFYKVPELLGGYNHKLLINIPDDVAPEKRGRCPAHTIDKVSKQSWYQEIAQVVLPMYRHSISATST